MSETRETIKTNIWFEEPLADNPFAAEACFCSGYDVYGDLLGKISWIQYLHLLFKLELPSPESARLLEILAVAIANPGIRDHGVRAAMNAGVGGSTRASALMAAIAVGAGNLNGGHEVVEMMRWWQRLGTDCQRWCADIHSPPQQEPVDTWRPMEHIPGFDPNGQSCPGPVRQTLEVLASIRPHGKLGWLRTNREVLEAAAGYPLAMSGVIATAFIDLDFDEGRGEMLYLLLRLPGAAVHALEQERNGWRNYPFFGSVLQPMADPDYWSLLESLKAKA